MSTKGERTRRRLLDAAWRRLSSGDPARLEDVAADAGITRQGLYRHYGSRTALLLALVQHIDHSLELGDRIRATLEPLHDPADRLEAMLRLMATYEAEIHGVAMALLRLADTDEDAASALEDRMAGRRTELRRLITELEQAGRLAPGWSVDEVVDVLWEAGAPSSWEHLVVERGWSLERVGDWIVHLGRSVLRPAAEGHRTVGPGTE